MHTVCMNADSGSQWILASTNLFAQDNKCVGWRTLGLALKVVHQNRKIGMAVESVMPRSELLSLLGRTFSNGSLHS